MRIELDDITRAEVRALLREHLTSMHSLGPPESTHALDFEGLQAPGVTVWTAWDGEILLGCGALKELDRTHGEIKSMRTPALLRRRGAGRAILAHILAEARARGYRRLSLETGAMPEFVPARKLYESFGFVHCGPFPPYKEDPYSVFMTLELNAGVTVSVRENAENAVAAPREPKP
ncbi:MAG TPA: GNAT family N-acetyltransferase [Gammaproteobacteria bacterium]